MQYNKSDLFDAITYCILTHDPNIWISTNAIYNKLIERDIVPEFNKTKTLQNRFEFDYTLANIISKNNNFLCRRTGKTLFIKIDDTILDDDETEADYTSDLTEEQLTKNINGTTMIHEICRGGDYQLLEKIVNEQIFKQGSEFTNDKEESLYDVVTESTPNGIKTLKLLMRMDNMTINKLIDNKHDLTRTIRMQTKDIEIMKKELNKEILQKSSYQTTNFRLFCFLIFVLIAFCYNIYKHNRCISTLL